MGGELDETGSGDETDGSVGTDDSEGDEFDDDIKAAGEEVASQDSETDNDSGEEDETGQDQDKETSASEEEGEDGTPSSTKDEDESDNSDVRVAKALTQRNKERELRIAAEAKATALEDEISRGSQSKPAETDAEPAFDVEKAYEDVEDLREDGDSKAASALQQKIDAHNRQEQNKEIIQAISQQSSLSMADENKNTIETKALTDYPFFDKKSDEYIPEAEEEFAIHRDYLMKHNIPIDMATQMAVDMIAPRHPQAKADDKNAASKAAADKKREDRTNETNALRDKARKQPSSGGGGVKRTGGEANLENMDIEEFEKRFPIKAGE